MENEILFENVSFSYDGKEVFRNLNVRIPSDRHVALVGENGAGKSRLSSCFWDFMSRNREAFLSMEGP